MGSCTSLLFRLQQNKPRYAPDKTDLQVSTHMLWLSAEIKKDSPESVQRYLRLVVWLFYAENLNKVTIINKLLSAVSVRRLVSKSVVVRQKVKREGRVLERSGSLFERLYINKA